MNAKDTEILGERRTALAERLETMGDLFAPVIKGSNLRYEMSARVQAMAYGGIGLIHGMVRSIGLAEKVDARVSVFKRHFPYFESDHVLSLAYNVVTGGSRLEDIERLRNDPAYLDALGCDRVPDPTTAGDFLRRFEERQIDQLQESINDGRVKIWKKHLSRTELKLACIDADGTIAPTTGECKEGMDVSYKGDWGYMPLLVSLGNTNEVLYLKNRPGNRPSHEGAVEYMDKAITLVRRGGFKKVRLRGDTDFSLTHNFDRWHNDGVEFVFGMDASPTLKGLADKLEKTAWKKLKRPVRIPTGERARRASVRDQIVIERGYKNILPEEETIAEFNYRPAACKNTYRVVALRKLVRIEERQILLAYRLYEFFYITNVTKDVLSSEDVIFEANARCNQENVIEQLKNGVQAMRLPSDTLLSNWAYMVIGGLAWNLKIWLGLSHPDPDRGQQIQRMEFRGFVARVIMVPCQIVRTGRQVVARILNATDWAPTLIDGMSHYRKWCAT